MSTPTRLLVVPHREEEEGCNDGLSSSAVKDDADAEVSRVRDLPQPRRCC